MKIALPITSFLPNIGGMEVGIHNLAKNLKALGHQPVIITSYSIFRKLQRKKKLPYEVTYFFPKMFSIFQKNHNLGLFLSEKYFKKLHNKYNFDFWHVTMAFPLGVMFINFAKRNNFKNYLIRAVGEDIQINKKINYGYMLKKENEKIIKKFLPKCKNFVSISNTIYERYKTLGIDSYSIHKIPNAVSTQRFKIKSIAEKKKLKERYNLPQNTIFLMTLGRNHPKKKYDFLIKLIKIMSLKNIRFRFLFIGQGVNKLKQNIDINKIGEHVILIDTLKDFDDVSEDFPSNKIIDYLLMSDIFIFPSIIESFGVVLVEAMAAGLPTIANDVPGCRDLVVDKKTGFLVKKPNNLNIFLDKINLLLNNKKLLGKMKEKSIEESKKYDWKKVCSRYLKLYRKIINQDIES